jgi:TNF receptor-associated protein 1
MYRHISLDTYIKSMKEGQKNIYFIVSNNPTGKSDSPFLEPFQNSKVPVLVLPNHIDEVCLRNVNEYKGFKFINIESNFEEVAGDLDDRIEHDKVLGIPEEEITPFSLWLKSELTPTIARVTISKRLANTPAVIVGQVSSSLRAMLAMVDQSQFEQAIKDQSLEINPNHPIMVKLNRVRKTDSATAKMLLNEIFNHIKLQSGIPFDAQEASKSSFSLIEMLMDYKLERVEDEPEVIVEDVREESILKGGK